MRFGGSQACVDKIRGLRADTGVDNLICWMDFGSLPRKLLNSSMQLFADEVMPALRNDSVELAIPTSSSQ
ncbi:MAG: hypothetical protein E4H01_09790 [Lysobacterales bacterium]|nr:MAG: hypothetical protein E4H01_09790 [Xanthomonadales bacterium]